VTPDVGDVVRGRDIPEKPPRYASQRFVWAQCPRCGYERWAFYHAWSPSGHRHCRGCAVVVSGWAFRVGKDANETTWPDSPETQ